MIPSNFKRIRVLSNYWTYFKNQSQDKIIGDFLVAPFSSSIRGERNVGYHEISTRKNEENKEDEAWNRCFVTGIEVAAVEPPLDTRELSPASAHAIVKHTRAPSQSLLRSSFLVLSPPWPASQFRWYDTGVAPSFPPYIPCLGRP